MQREDIHIISRHSDVSEQCIDKALKEKVYNNKEAWHKFFLILFISLGVGFTVSGIVFFFAYNWAELHKFAKIGLTQGLLVATVLLVLLPKFTSTVRKLIITGAAVLVGVLFAVYGQIYQTGANAYDFFLAWTIFVTLWALVSNFAPLWLLYLVLINTTFIFYSEQVATDWSLALVCIVLFIFHFSVLLSIHISGIKKIPDWFLNIVSLAAIGYATMGVVSGIFDEYELVFPLLLSMVAIAYALGLWYGLKTKRSFYLSVIPFSIIIMIAALLIKISNGEIMLLMVSLFIVTSVTLTIKNLIDIQKKWANEV